MPNAPMPRLAVARCRRRCWTPVCKRRGWGPVPLPLAAALRAREVHGHVGLGLLPHAWNRGFPTACRPAAVRGTTPALLMSTVRRCTHAWTSVKYARGHPAADRGGAARHLSARAAPEREGTLPFLGTGEINRAYQMLYTGFEFISGKDRFITRPKKPSVFNDDAPPTFPLPGGGSGGTGGSSGGSFSLSKLLEAIWDFVRDALEYAGELALWLVSQVTTPLTYPIRYALYLLQLALYEAYRHFRWGMAISGWVFPEPDELGNALAQQFINPSVSTFAQVMTRPLQSDLPSKSAVSSSPAPPLSPSRGPAVLTAAIRRITPTGLSSWSRRSGLRTRGRACPPTRRHARTGHFVAVDRNQELCRQPRSRSTSISVEPMKLLTLVVAPENCCYRTGTWTAIGATRRNAGT